MLQLREDAGEKLSRGTRITLHLKEDAHDLADDKKLGSLIKQYSEFISFPIKLWSSSQDFQQVPSPFVDLLTWACLAGLLSWPFPDISQCRIW